MALRIITRIDRMTDDIGYVVSSGDHRVDVFPPHNYDDSPKDGFISISAHGISSSDAREIARLLLFAADYLETLQK